MERDYLTVRRGFLYEPDPLLDMFDDLEHPLAYEPPWLRKSVEEESFEEYMKRVRESLN